MQNAAVILEESFTSVSGLAWRMRPHAPQHALAIAQQNGVPEIIGRILAGRGIKPEHAASHLAPTLRNLLPDPFHLKDMDKAAQRVAAAIRQKEIIGIFGDYDVDGATSSALLVRYLRAFGITPLVHIPDRMKEGYGPNVQALLGLQAKGASLVITVDCGTMAFEPLAEARKAGLEVIVIDHHKGEARLPEAYAVVNPNRADEMSEHTHLAAVGVAFLLLVAVNKCLREQGLAVPDLLPFLDLVALGTICDVVSLTGVNRAFVTQGLKIMKTRGNAGIQAAMDIAGLAEAPGTYHAGFVIGPRINAGGRVGQSDLGIRLLATEDALEARELAEALNRFNAERKAIESIVLAEAMAQAAALPETDAIILVAQEGWHAGVIGIVAGRLKEHYNKPTAVIALSEGTGKASARSVSGIDLGACVIAAVQQGLLKAGGGHAMAAGFSMEGRKLAELRAFFNASLGSAVNTLGRERKLMLDGSVSLPGVTLELAQLLEQAGPFGAGNPSVRIWLPHLRIVRADIIGDGHVRVILSEVAAGMSSASLKAMAFRCAETPLGQALLNARGRSLHVAGQARINSWQGRENVDFFIDDVAWA